MAAPVASMKEETATANNTTMSEDNGNTMTDSDQQNLRLLDGIATVQRQYLQAEQPKKVFGTLLDKLLDLMDSEYGFIGEVKYSQNDNGATTTYLQTHAITNIAWNAATRQFYDDNVDSGLKFENLQSLFGTVIVTAEPMVCNDPSNHPNACGIPEGHPPLNHFLGIPFFESAQPSGNTATDSTDNTNNCAAGNKKMVGMVGIANKPGGYKQADVDFLEPFTVTCSNLIQAYNAIRKNKELVETLEQRVLERTTELQKANASLEEANRRVVRASHAQLTNFASMSHEIRTPLNCIIGLSSLLQETELTPYQNDCLKMIVTSGDLLLTVVNDVLDYSKLESGNVDISIRPSNIQTCLDAVVHSIAQKARSKNLRVETSYAPNVPEIIPMDNRRLQQVLYNLLGNSVKFSEDNAAIELKVGILENPYQTNDDDNSEKEMMETTTSSIEEKSGEEMIDIDTASEAIAKTTIKEEKTNGTTAAADSPATTTSIKSKNSNPRKKKCPRTGEPDGSFSDGSGGQSSSDESGPVPKREPQNGNETNDQNEGTQKAKAGACPFLPADKDQETQKSKAGVCPFLPADENPSHDIIMAQQKMKRESIKCLAQQKHPIFSSNDSNHGGFYHGRHDESDDDVFVDDVGPALEKCSKILRFSVKDYGTGIPQKDFKRIFKPFKQANLYTETNHGGTGLGLAITTKLVKGLGGTISVDSVMGEWTEFTVDFPFTEEPFDVEPLTKELQLATIVSVEKDGSATNNNKNEDVDILLKELGVNVRKFNSMGSLLQSMRQPSVLKEDRFYLTLVDESLYDASAYQQFSEMVKLRTSLITHGPGYSVEGTNLHIRCLRQMLPSVLMSSLVLQMQATAQRRPIEKSVEAARPISYDRLKILIAEDNIINQKVLGRMLSRLGVTNVEFADNGEIAVSKNETQTYDVVFMDMQMPVMDGLEATKLIVRQRGEKSLPKVIFVTANVSEKFEEEAADAGGDGFISKPFSLGVIEKVFSLHL